MTDYAIYLRALEHLSTAEQVAADDATRRDDRYTGEVDGARQRRDGAHTRHERLRGEVTRQVDAARDALSRVGRADLLPADVGSASVDSANPEDVTAAVRALQSAVADLKSAVTAEENRPRGSTAVIRKYRPLWVVLGLFLCAVVLFAAAYLIAVS
jgi:hypothetical protein